MVESGKNVPKNGLFRPSKPPKIGEKIGQNCQKIRQKFPHAGAYAGGRRGAGRAGGCARRCVRGRRRAGACCPLRYGGGIGQAAGGIGGGGRWQAVKSGKGCRLAGCAGVYPIWYGRARAWAAALAGCEGGAGRRGVHPAGCGRWHRAGGAGHRGRRSARAGTLAPVRSAQGGGLSCPIWYGRAWASGAALAGCEGGAGRRRGVHSAGCGRWHRVSGGRFLPCSGCIGGRCFHLWRGGSAPPIRRACSTGAGSSVPAARVPGRVLHRSGRGVYPYMVQGAKKSRAGRVACPAFFLSVVPGVIGGRRRVAVPLHSFGAGLQDVALHTLPSIGGGGFYFGRFFLSGL